MKLIDVVVANQSDLISQFDQLVDELQSIRHIHYEKSDSLDKINMIYESRKGQCEGALAMLKLILSKDVYSLCLYKYSVAAKNLRTKIDRYEYELKAFEYFNQLFTLYQSINDIPTPKIERFRRNQLPQLSDLEFQTLFDEWKDQLNVEPVES